MKFSDFPQAVIKENVDYTVKEITNVIKKYGPRESGNENCYAAQKHIKKEMDTFCDGTEFESYKMAPKAFLHFTKLVSVVIFLAVVVCAILMYTSIITPLLAQCIVCGVVFVGLFITVMEFLLYKQFMDPLYKKIEAHNLMGVRKPRGEVKRRIVISGHIDAAYEWRHLYYGKKVPLMAIFMSWTIGGAIVSFILSVIAIVANFVDMGTFGDFMINYSYIFHFVTALGMVTLFMFVDFNTISPGANDNLTGTYAAVCALRMLDMAGVDFENTEVCAMITDGEEAGLRGCKSWAKNHYDEYVNSGVETVVLCVDTLTDREYLRVYNKDMTGTVKIISSLANWLWTHQRTQVMMTLNFLLSFSVLRTLLLFRRQELLQRALPLWTQGRQIIIITAVTRQIALFLKLSKQALTLLFPLFLILTKKVLTK